MILQPNMDRKPLRVASTLPGTSIQDRRNSCISHSWKHFLILSLVIVGAVLLTTKYSGGGPETELSYLERALKILDTSPIIDGYALADMVSKLRHKLCFITQNTPELGIMTGP